MSGKRIWIAVILLFTVMACQQNRQKKKSGDDRLFSRTDYRELREVIDHRRSAELIPYFNSEDANLRNYAALGAGSMQDSSLTQFLLNLLTDPDPTVRKNAAWALGQTPGHIQSERLRAQLESEFHQDVRNAIFPAFAKSLADPSAYPRLVERGQDTEAWLWGVYQLVLKNRQWQDLPDVTPFLAHPMESVRLAASHVLSRSQKELDEYAATEIELRFLLEASEQVRMALALALRNSPFDASDSTLLVALQDKNESDLVKVNVLRSLRSGNMQPPTGALVLLEQEKGGISEETALWMRAYPAMAEMALERLGDKIPVRSRSILLQSIQRAEADNSSWPKFKTLFEAQNDIYDQAACITHFPPLGESAEMLSSLADSLNHPVLFSAMAEAAMSWPPDVPGRTALIKTLLRKGDPGAVSTIAQSYMDGSIVPGEMQLNSMDSLLKVLKLPSELETYNIVVEVLNKFRSAGLETYVSDVLQPIHWEQLDSLSDHPSLIIHTSKGEIQVELFPEIAPGTVADVVRLSREGYYDGKFFHRVVPNFVAQAGCPRGDGWGSMDYTLRSEFSDMQYRRGAVGMASAGRDTESCQWFITHSPTPHLEGRYTLFGYVSKGMDVVENLLIGDRIIRIEVIP